METQRKEKKGKERKQTESVPGQTGPRPRAQMWHF